MKYAIIGTAYGTGSLAIQALKEQYGQDLVIITAAEAAEMQLDTTHIVNLPTMKIENYAPQVEYRYTKHKCGKQKRRERRAAMRKKKKR